MEPVTIIVWIFVGVFFLTAIITLGGIVENFSLIQVPDKYLKGLYVALLLEIVGASVTIATGVLNNDTKEIEAKLEIANQTITTLKAQLESANICGENDIVFHNPKPGNQVGYETIISGSFSPKCKDVDLWLILQPVESPRFYPADGPILKTTNGIWKGTIYFGTSESDAIGEEFYVFIASTTPDASKALKDYYQNSTKTKSWNGLVSLPKNTLLHNSITLTKK